MEVAIPILVGGILAACVIALVEKNQKSAVSNNNTEGKEVKPE